jgi:hypothetical protein
MASNSINSTTQNLHAEGLNDEDWSNLFCARDEDEEEYIPADESSDSDSDLEPMDMEETEFEDEMDESPAIQVGRTQVLRNRLAEGEDDRAEVINTRDVSPYRLRLLIHVIIRWQT